MRGVAFLLLLAGVCSAQVQNAADVNAGAFTTNLAPGSLAAIQFSQTTGTSVTSATVSLLPVNTTTAFPATVTSVAPFNIMFIVPPAMPSGPAQLIYKPGTQATQWTTVNIVPTSFSLYRTGSGGPLIAQDVPASGPAYPIGMTTPAQPGNGVQLWGTGLGSIAQGAVQVTLGGVAQRVLYAGPANVYPELTQINFLVAPGTPDGCYVPLVVTYGTQSATSFLSKTSDGMPCHHPWGLSVQAMKLLDSGTSIEVGEIAMSTGIEAASGERASRQESAQLTPDYLNAAQIAAYFTTSAPIATQPCSPSVAESGIIESIFGPAGPNGPTTLENANSTLTLPFTSPQGSDSALSNLPPPVIAAGAWTWNTASASGVPQQVSFPFALPPPVQLAGGAPIMIDRTQGATISWNGAGYDANAVLKLTLSTGPMALPALSCAVAAQAGSVRIPANLLVNFSAGNSGVLSVSVSENGPGIPAGDFVLDGSPFVALVLWNSTDARPVDFQ